MCTFEFEFIEQSHRCGEVVEINAFIFIPVPLTISQLHNYSFSQVIIRKFIVGFTILFLINVKLFDKPSHPPHMFCFLVELRNVEFRGSMNGFTLKSLFVLSYGMILLSSRGKFESIVWNIFRDKSIRYNTNF